MSRTLVTFEPLDSIFFREARPFNAGEGGFLDSQFPPAAQTLSGAIRGAIGEASGVDWTKKQDVERLLGTADEPLHKFAGPYLIENGRRIYPVPLNLHYSKKVEKWARLLPSGAESEFETDMGKLQLPKPMETLEGAKPVEEGWLDAANLQRVLKGELPESCIPAKDIFVREPRVGIGRNNQKAIVNEGQLYFTRHLRLCDGFALGMCVEGTPLPVDGIVRLGGEGRLARITTGAQPDPLDAPKPNGTEQGLILTLLTHGDFGGNTEPDWSAIDPSLMRITACVGKPVREGGWDYAQKKPKPLKSLVPAGSCYFVKVNAGNLQRVITALHGKSIGQRTQFGYGEIAVGLWK
jgi:CRISPR-associated protein Cmr3